VVLWSLRSPATYWLPRLRSSPAVVLRGYTSEARPVDEVTGTAWEYARGHTERVVSSQIRRLVPGDEPLAELACRTFGIVGDFDPAAFLARPEAVLLIVERGDDVAGWLYGHELVHPDGERTMLLYALEVAEGRRGQGWGKALVSAFVDHAASRGCTEVWVLTNHDNRPAIATYTSAGGSRNGSGQVMFTWRLAPGRHS
jgi:ribosomal protein S18 acetylase RimI-like enzyme